MEAMVSQPAEKPITASELGSLVKGRYHVAHEIRSNIMTPRIAKTIPACLCLLLCSCRDQTTETTDGSDASRSHSVSNQATADVFPGAGEYAGSESCAECHQDLYDLWATSNHAHAQRDMSDELDHPAFTPPRTVTHGSQTSHVAVKEGRYTITTKGPEGEVRDFHPEGVLAYRPLRQYLIPFSDGRLQATELAYDPAKDEWFNVYGDEDRRPDEWGHWSQRGMNWNSMCGMCHNTGYEKNYDPEIDGYATTFKEMGVGCEQCHGPMKDHVLWRKDYPDFETYPDDPTVTWLDNDQMFDVCGSCHARRGELTTDFMPGDAFLDHYEPVLPDLTDTFYPDGQVREEDFEFVPFLLSYMHHQGIRCINCHDSHSGNLRFEGNTMCLQCHSQPIGSKPAIDPITHSHHEADTPGAACTDCHMPTTPYMQRHWRHDHGMTIPDPLLTVKHDIPNACTRCHDDQSADWALEWTEEWYGEKMDRRTRHRAIYLAELKAGDFTHVTETLHMLEDEPNATWRAVIIRFLIAVLERGPVHLHQPVVDAIVSRLDDESPLVQATAIEALDPYAPRFVEELEAKLEHPNRLVRVKAAWALRATLDPQCRAARDLLNRMEVHQDQPLGALQWATFLADRGAPLNAIPWFRKAIAWDPNSAPFRHSYAVVLSSLGRIDAAVDQLLEAIETDPESSIYPYSLALLYSERGQIAEARDTLLAAIDRDPEVSRYWYNLALAESQLGNHDAALSAITRAESIDPHLPDYPYVRATLHFGANEFNRALTAARRALDIDPNHQAAHHLIDSLRP